MLFTQTAEYALRAMAFLAVTEPGALVSSDTLAEEASIPRPYVPKVMRPLALAGMVEARRGRGGGFRLLLAPERVSFHAVLAASGALPDPDHCAFGHVRCNPRDPCLLHHNWTVLQDLVDRWARETTLADVGPRGELPAMPG